MAITVSEAESSVQRGLEALRNAPLNDQITQALKYLTPEGYRPVVQFEEDGRKKRSTASAETLTPATLEILIYFESQEACIAESPIFGAERKAAPPGQPATVAITSAATSATKESCETTSPPTELEIIECCQAMANAEKAGKHFIALKWFRDDLLPATSFAWAQSPQRRHLVLTEAIESGRVSTKKIPNPKAPQFPTTTISLNREIPIPGILPRFRPIPVRGEPASETLLRDRGPR